MEKDKANQLEIQTNNVLKKEGHILSYEEQKRLVDFFSILLQIDTRLKKEKSLKEVSNCEK